MVTLVSDTLLVNIDIVELLICLVIITCTDLVVVAQLVNLAIVALLICLVQVKQTKRHFGIFKLCFTCCHIFS